MDLHPTSRSAVSYFLQFHTDIVTGKTPSGRLPPIREQANRDPLQYQWIEKRDHVRNFVRRAAMQRESSLVSKLWPFTCIALEWNLFDQFFIGKGKYLSSLSLKFERGGSPPSENGQPIKIDSFPGRDTELGDRPSECRDFLPSPKSMQFLPKSCSPAYPKRNMSYRSGVTPLHSADRASIIPTVP
jgi:hypothetical protein